ncbi:MAG TPA: TadE family protein [Alphaproteobacteria bacterium]|jgi:Flp pilus assembly protein TadG|nr:pilus assembly protein [Alphaproteobacteria bacterium]MDP6270238.1 pilus assembly protein [Alphaproteobacteria bacterium]MDP7164693.1 pilus assembly protein [Alphaproteobacteria bacterium]MDP7427678.1 pilus assembly protein [Alphaproteobacteria bacterium]HJM49098.1 TadE family protein [Alphaproteobacteria bacterium]
MTVAGGATPFGLRGRALRVLRPLLGQRRGAAAVELALVMPVLLTVVFGVIQYGLVIHTRHVMVYAAREAARCYVVDECDAGAAEALALNRLSDTPFGYTVTVTEPEEGDSDVTVSISLPMAEAAIISYLSDALFAGNIEASVTMRVESDS